MTTKTLLAALLACVLTACGGPDDEHLESDEAAVLSCTCIKTPELIVTDPQCPFHGHQHRGDGHDTAAAPSAPSR